MLRPQRAEADHDRPHGFFRPDQAVAARAPRSSSSSGSTRSSAGPTTPEQRSRPVDVETIEALEEALISADVGVAATDRIVEAVARGDAAASRCATLVKAEILRDPRARRAAGAANGQRPHVVLIVGVNGTGKTTTVGKLARLIKDGGQTPLICAADTFRAAAVEQLEIWATRAGVDIIRAQGRRRPGGGRVRRDRRRQGARAATSSWSIPPGGCTRAST